MKKTRINRALFLILSVVLAACTSGGGFTMYKSVAKEGLSIEPVIFELPEHVIDSGLKNVFIRLRNDSKYPFANIFLVARLQAGDQFVIQDTLEYAMAAPDGEWLGNGFTEVKESKLWWKEGVIFPKERPINIAISQAVRKNGTATGVVKLKGIISVGISVEDQ